MYALCASTMSSCVFSFLTQLIRFGSESVGQSMKAATSLACFSGVESKAQLDRAEPDSAMACWKYAGGGRRRREGLTHALTGARSCGR